MPGVAVQDLRDYRCAKHAEQIAAIDARLRTLERIGWVAAGASILNFAVNSPVLINLLKGFLP